MMGTSKVSVETGSRHAQWRPEDLFNHLDPKKDVVEKEN